VYAVLKCKVCNCEVYNVLTLQLYSVLPVHLHTSVYNPYNPQLYCVSNVLINKSTSVVY